MSSTSINPASSVVLFGKRPSEIHTVSVLQWFLSRLFQSIKLGGAMSKNYKFGTSGEWVIIRISSADGSDELLLPGVKKARKLTTSTSGASGKTTIEIDSSAPGAIKPENRQLEAMLLPSTEILFTFASFSLTLVVEIRLSSSYTSSGPSVDTQIKHELASTLNGVLNSLRNQYYVSRVYICIMGYCAEHDLSYLLFRGEVSHTTDPELFQQSILLRMVAAQKELRDFTQQHQSYKRFPSFSGYLQCAIKGCDLLPPETFTKTIIIMTEEVGVDSSKCQEFLLGKSIPVYVSCIRSVRQSMPILSSFAATRYELRALVESTRGRLLERFATNSESDSDAPTVDSFVGPDLFTYSYLTECPRSRHTLAWQLRSHASVIALHDTLLQRYVLSDITLEHLIASRLAEGFRITTIKFNDPSHSQQHSQQHSQHSQSYHTQSGVNLIGNNNTSNSVELTPSRQNVQNTGRQTGRTGLGEKWVIIRFQKVVSGLSILLYEISFRWSKSASSTSVPSTSRSFSQQSNSFASARDRITSMRSFGGSPRTTSDESIMPSLSRIIWMRGPVNVEIKCSAVPTTVTTVKQNLDSAISTAKSILDFDSDLSSLLSLPFLPVGQLERFSVQSRDPRKSQLRTIERNIEVFDAVSIQDGYHKQYYYICSHLSHQNLVDSNSEIYSQMSSDVSLFSRESFRIAILNSMKEGFSEFSAELKPVLYDSKALLILSNLSSVVQYVFILHVVENYRCFMTVSIQHLNIFVEESQNSIASKLFQCIESALSNINVSYVRLRCDLSHAAMFSDSIHARNMFQRSESSLLLLDQIYAKHMLVSDKSKESLSLQFLLSDILRIKESLGWQCIFHFSDDSHISLIMVAVVSNCPTGQRQEALLQFHMKALFTHDGVSLEYEYRFPRYVDLTNPSTSSSFITATANASKDSELINSSTTTIARSLTEYLKLSHDLDEDTFHLYSICFRLRHAVNVPKSNNASDRAFSLNDWTMLTRFSVGKEMKLYSFHNKGSYLNADVIKMLFAAALKNVSNLSTMRVEGGTGGDSFDVLVWAQGSSLVLMRFPNQCEEEDVYITTAGPDGQGVNNESADARFFDEDETEADVATEKKVFYRVSARLIELPCSKLNPDFTLFKKTGVSVLGTKSVRDDAHFKWQKTFELQRRSVGSVENSFMKMQTALEELHELSVLHRLTESLKSTLTMKTSNADASVGFMNESIINEKDIEYILKSSNTTEYEVDISAMFRRIAKSLAGRGGMHKKPMIFGVLFGAFMETIGKHIGDSLGGHIFTDLVTSSDPFSVSSFGKLSYNEMVSQLSNHHFAQFSLMYRVDDSIQFTTKSLPSTCCDLIDNLITQAVQLLTSSRFISDSFEVVLKLHIISPRLSTCPNSSWICTEENASCSGYSLIFIPNLCKSVRQFVAAESLLHFIQPSLLLTADDLILVQQSLIEQDNVVTREVNVEFFAPVTKYARGQSATTQADSLIISLLATQLKLLQPSSSQKSDVIYLRQWVLEPTPTETSTDSASTLESFAPERKESNEMIPLWILMTLVTADSATASKAEDLVLPSATNQSSNVANTQPIISLRLSLSLKLFGNGVENTTITQDSMLSRCFEALRKCWFKVNQAILLKNLFETQTSSPLLIVPPVKPVLLAPVSSSGNLPSISETSTVKTPVPKSRPPIPTLSTLVRKPTDSNAAAPSKPPNQAAGSHITGKPGSVSNIPPRAPKSAPKQVEPTSNSDDTSSTSTPINTTEGFKLSEPTESQGIAQLDASPFVAGTPKIDIDSLPFRLNTSKLTENGSFACTKQGEVVCSVYPCVTLNQESIVRSLEALALSQFSVQNNERYFVSKDVNGSVFYMLFEVESVKEKEGGRAVKLNLFGITPPDSQILLQLKEVLSSRLIEISARAVSASLRTSSLTTNTLSFLKSASPSKHFHAVIKLPPYVHDVYLFCLIARQLFLQSPILSAVKLPASQQASERKHHSFSEYINPAFIGYAVSKPVTSNDNDESSDDEEDDDEYNVDEEESDSMPNSGRSIDGPQLRLVRKTHVSLYDDSKRPHPIFCEISKEPADAHRYAFTEGASAIWQQTEFSFIYNTLPIGPGPAQAGRQQSTQGPTSSSKVSSASQGLALVELLLAPAGQSQTKNIKGGCSTTDTFTLVTTGGFLQVCDDIRILDEMLSSDSDGEEIGIGLAERTEITRSLGKSISTTISSEPHLSSTKVQSASYSALQVLESDMELHLHILPTLPMQQQFLIDLINSVLDQSLIWYVFERVLATSNDDTQLGNHAWMETSIDLFQKAFHRIKKTSIPSTVSSATSTTSSPYWDHFLVPCMISDQNMHELLENMKTLFEDISPALASTTTLLKRGSKKATINNDDNLVDCLVASRFHFETSKQFSKSGKLLSETNPNNNFTVLSDYESSVVGDIPLPYNVKRRHYFLVGFMVGSNFSLYSFNINIPTLMKIKEFVNKNITRLIQKERLCAIDNIPLVATRLRNQVRSKTSVDNTNRCNNQDQLNNLFALGDNTLGLLSWQHRKLKHVTKSEKAPTTEIISWFQQLPADVWRHGESLESKRMKSPCVAEEPSVIVEQFHNLIQSIVQSFIVNEKCEVFIVNDPDDPLAVFLIFPQPRQRSAFILDIKMESSGVLSITPRLGDISELLIAALTYFPHPVTAFSDSVVNAYLLWVRSSIDKEKAFSVYDALSLRRKSLRESAALCEQLNQLCVTFMCQSMTWFGVSMHQSHPAIVLNLSVRDIEGILKSWSDSLFLYTSTHLSTRKTDSPVTLLRSTSKFGRVLNLQELKLDQLFVPLKVEADESGVSSSFSVQFVVYPHHKATSQPSVTGFAVVEIKQRSISQPVASSEPASVETVPEGSNNAINIDKVDEVNVSLDTSVCVFAMNASSLTNQSKVLIDSSKTVIMTMEPTLQSLEPSDNVPLKVSTDSSMDVTDLQSTSQLPTPRDEAILQNEDSWGVVDIPAVISDNIYKLISMWQQNDVNE